jgi:acetyltransferase-like isoleucine patch superfamily enzyme
LSKIRVLAQRFLIPRFVVTLYYFVKSRSSISPRAEVELSPNLKLGGGVTISSFTKIKSTGGPLTIGHRSGFATGCFVSSGEGGVRIGENVLCGPNVTILASSYVHESLEIPFEDQGIQSKGVRIGNNVWIGAGSVIADGAVVGDNTIVVANSLVTRRYPPNVIIQGAPAKVILRRGRAAATEPSKGESCEPRSSTSSKPPSATSTLSSATPS